MRNSFVLFLAISVFIPGSVAVGGNPEKGLQLLLDKAYLPADLDQEVFDALWTVWPEPLKSKAEQASSSGAAGDGYESIWSFAAPE